MASQNKMYCVTHWTKSSFWYYDVINLVRDLLQVKNAIRVSQQNGRNSEMYPIRLATLAVPRPSSLSLKTWTEFILSMGFKFSQTNNLNINNNNDENDSSYLASVIASLNETNNNNNNNNNNTNDNNNNNNNNNYNNNNGNVSSNELGDLSVIVPAGLVPSRLMKYRHVLTGLLGKKS